MEFELSTDGGVAVHDVTEQVAAALPPDAEGTCTVFCRHTTAAVVVNEAESRLLSDLERWLGSVVAEADWDHDRLDDNAAAHLRALALGPSVTLPVAAGDLDVGTWQSVLFVECDGPRRRTVAVLA